MGYTALYRKFRPASFEEVKGQDSIVTTLKNQIQANRVGHAYLFCGTRGTGKTSVAKLFAKAVNCEDTSSADPCCKCQSCLSIAAGSSTNVIEIDAASNNSVDDVRNIREEVAYRPTEGKYKVYIIDEAHMLSTGAFNALLKTLEEPPEYVIFILATTEAAKLPITIVSRCQRYDFKRISIDRIADRLMSLLEKEGIKADPKGVRYVARLADGSMRDALSLLERWVSGHLDGELSYNDALEVLGTVDSEGFEKMFKAIQEKDITGAIRQLEDYAVSGKDMSSFSSDFSMYLRNLLLAKNTEGIEDILDVSDDELIRLKEAASSVNDDVLMRYIRTFSELTGVLKNSSSKRIEVELALIKLCRPETSNDISGLLNRISELEEKVSNMKMEVPKDLLESLKNARPEKEPVREKPVIKRAAPAELVKIKDKWQNIISAIPSNGIKVMLSGSTTMYDGSSDDSRLYVKVVNQAAKDFMSRDEHKAILTDAIIKEIGGTTEIVFVSDDDNDMNRRLAPINAAKKLQESFEIPIEIEE